jgi:hypothetical protein
MNASNLKTWIIVNAAGNCMSDKMAMESAQKKADKMNAVCLRDGLSGAYSLKYVG